MPATRRTAISYTRFSDPKQAGGDSETRQAVLFREFCQSHNLTPLTEVWADRGRSGYHDAHRKRGRLGELIAYAKEGRFEPGTVIVVEAWDRLGRLRPDRQTALVAELLGTGVSIGVCRLNDIFTEADLGGPKWYTLQAFIPLAYQESRQKSERVAASWQRERERMRREGATVARRLPAWLERTGDAVRLVPERAAAVRRIFEMAAAGYGHTRVVGTLVREGVRPFGEMVVREGRGRSQFAGRWTKPYIALILKDRRAVGEFQPRLNDGTPDGPPLAGYYPAAVGEELFLLARAAQAGRKGGRDVPGGQGRGGYVNVFRGVLLHARDGEGFHLHNKGTTARPELILVNATGLDGRGQCFTFPYPVFETAVLSRLIEVKASDVLPAAGAEPSRADVLRARLANVRADIAGLQSELREGFSKALAAVLREKEGEETTLADALQDELAKSARPAAQAWEGMPGLVEMLRTAADPDDARLRLRVVLQQCVEDVRALIVPRGAVRLVAVQVNFRGGAHRGYLIYHRTAGYRRESSLWVRSAVWPTRGPLDLRKPRDAAKLARELERLDLGGRAAGG
jgi:DNA invertase Pin-like site-specific DNA recombinase